MHTAPTRLYQQAVAELLHLTVADPQAGFKAFTAAALTGAENKVLDRGLSFDTELLAVVRDGHAVAEVGVAALHHWADGQQGTPRDYDHMLSAVREQSRRHGHEPDTRPTPVLDRILAAPSLAEAAARTAPADVTIVPGPR